MSDRATDSARKRLQHAHQLWHQALESYPDVDQFLPNVNALITTLRSVTFVLQKALKRYPGFDVWYAGQQVAMRADPILKWLVEARNHIEKEGDLDIRSTARVSVIAGWHAGEPLEFDVPPLTPPHHIAQSLAMRHMPDGLREEGVLRVERRWVTVSIPDEELLDACARAYAALDRIIRGAQVQFSGLPLDTGSQRLPCMIAAPEARTALLHLATGEFVGVARNPHEYTDADEARVEAKYGEMIRALGKPGTSLEERAEWYHRMARGMFLIDRAHLTIATLVRDGIPLRGVSMEPEDQPDKYLMMDVLAQLVAEVDADEVLIIGEVWNAPALDPAHPDAQLRAGQRSDRTESLVTYGMNRAGQTLGFTSGIIRSEGKVRLADMKQWTGMNPQDLLPVWREWHGRTAKPPWEGHQTRSQKGDQ